MKRLISLFLVLAVALASTAVVFAAPPVWETPGAGQTVTSSPQNIPVYGYIGLGTSGPVDIDGGGTDVTPPGGGNLISVTIPTKVLWAAFAVSGTAVTSPTYGIINNSDLIGLDVALDSFDALVGDAVAIETANTLTLDISGDISATDVVDISTAVSLGTLNRNSTWAFSITGEYSGLYAATALEPEYTMVLSFAAA